MKLAKFKTDTGDTVYINPDFVSAILFNSKGVWIEVNGNENWHIADMTDDEVISRLRGY